MNESFPSQTETKEAKDVGLLLQERLAEVEVDENVPESMREIARLEQLLIDLDRPDYDNKDRHLAWEAERALAEALRSEDLSQKQHMLYMAKYRPRHPDASALAA